jgi:hypothetical protein
MSGLNLGGSKPATTLGTGVATQATKPADAPKPTPETQPTESQADANKTVEVPKMAGEIADAVAAADSTLREDVAARWSSHPIQRYTVGNYHFEHGLLVLETQKEADEFQAVFDELPIYEKSRLNKIDLSSAEAMVRERIATGGGATKAIDSSVGDRAPAAEVGSGVLGE